MTQRDAEVVVIGGGAAGVAAARRLHDASIRCLLVEARPRLGGRAFTYTDPSGFALDLGCGWLHSADHNPWVKIAEEQGAAIDRTAPAWSRPPLETGFPRADYRDYREALTAYYERVHRAGKNQTDTPASSVLVPGSRWNGLLNAVSTYISGAELDRVSLEDLDRYDSTDLNWRVAKGYGALVSTHAANVPAELACPVSAIDRRGKCMRIVTAKGDIEADQVILTVPTDVLAAGRISFVPALPEKIAAASRLPLGLADKLFISLDGAEEFEKDVRLFAYTDRARTAGYNFRPFGRPMIEAYFAGSNAAELEKGGEAAFFDFAVAELTHVFGNAFAARLKPIAIHLWRQDQFALGSYSYAMPGYADCRKTLAEPVDGRLFFAGEACSEHDFSTAHGGYKTGIAAADAVIATRRNISR
jgi:monoamine oxidase